MLARYNRWNRPEEDDEEEEEGILVGGTTVCRGKQDGDVFLPLPLGQSLLNPTLVQRGKELHFFVLEADFLPHGARTVGVIIVPCFVAGCSGAARPSSLSLPASVEPGARRASNVWEPKPREDRLGPPPRHTRHATKAASPLSSP